jgi:hypothetical protein
MEATGNPMLLQGRATLDSTHPVVVEHTLNEFIVFRKPGHYVIHCNSGRLMSGPTAKVESTCFAIDILPRDEAETARQFASARATLEAGKPPKEPERVFVTAKENAQADAVQTLRYLESEDASTYLASIYGQGRRTGDEIEYAESCSPSPRNALRVHPESCSTCPGIRMQCFGIKKLTTQSGEKE